MTRFAPRNLLAMQALVARGDPHARGGVHLRVLPSAVLGLPIAPLLVHRLAFSVPPLNHDVMWVDSRGLSRTPPFDVRPDNPVHGYFTSVPDAVCGWVRVHAGASLNAPQPPDLLVQAQCDTARGWAAVAARSTAPWAVSATPVQRIEVRGSGRVESVDWIDLRRLPDSIDNAVAQLHLPLQRARRYQAVADDAYAYAMGQVARAASTRRALHEVPWVAGPADALPWTPALEERRVELLAAGLVADLQRLMDAAERQRDVRDAHAIQQAGAALPGGGTLSQPLLAQVLAAAQDPAIARFLGLLTWDGSLPLDELPQSPDAGWVYHVLGFWEVEERDGEYGVVQSLTPGQQRQHGRADLFWPLPDHVPVYTQRRRLRNDMEARGLKIPAGPLGPVALLNTAAVVLAADPMPDSPAPPRLQALAPVEPAWQPGVVPPQARRRVAIGVGGLHPGAGLALARRSEQAPVWLPLNPRVQTMFNLIVPGAPAGATEPGQSGLGDRDAPAIAAGYRLAQCDGFGRWSGWVEGEVAAGVRPPPPRPVLEASYLPAEPRPGDAAPLAGRIRVQVAVPAPASLPPGAWLLQHLQLRLDGASVATLPPGSEAALVSLQPGPALGPTQRRTVRVSAVWVDSAGQESADSLPVSVNCHDLRAPAPVQLPQGLQYARRADATGRCRATLEWPVMPGQARYRVYVAHESALRAGLQGLGETALLAELDAADAPARAALWCSPRVRPLLERHLFEQLTAEPLVAAGGTMRYEHALSASLAGLSCYRVVAVAETHVEAPFATGSLTAVAVPHSPAPRPPGLEAAAFTVPLADGRSVPGIRVRLTVASGLRPAVSYRLFRSTEETRDVLRMPQVAAGPLAPPAAAGAPQVHTVLLVGDAAPGRPDPALVGPYDEVLPADVRLWMRYNFRADVQGAPEPGSGVAGLREVPGERSASAAPVAVLVVAAQPPAAAHSLEYRPAQQRVRWQHADELRGRHAGRYQFDVYRTTPGAREAWLASVAGDAAPADGGRNADGSGFFHVPDPQGAAGTRYRIVLSDPLGRASPVAELVVRGRTGA